MQYVIERQALNDDGYLYFAYPKKNNPKYKEYIDRDSFMAHIPVDEEGYVQSSRLKFSRMVSLDEVFTVVGLKSQAPKKKAASARSSQCVDDYIGSISDIRRYLESHMKDILAQGYKSVDLYRRRGQ
ncbi:hypothetical protein J2Z22_002597 [Paenibacillus forsythiae]|uniref:Uncharacterized protein n=1 Tax=Paenibacillus forsythiae TaxID=365616 RepID=A0ABU3H8A2_9BACL|nr:hypothetical protein [Paenibacillus forsythiae]MDT3427063.1 hypothetical protein [Paenibacillus forsythiae]